MFTYVVQDNDMMTDNTLNTRRMTVPRSPHEVGAILDRLTEPLGNMLAAVGFNGVQIIHRPSDGRLVAYANDGPDSAEVTYARMPMMTPYDMTQTEIGIHAHDNEGKAVAQFLTVALAVMQ